MHYSDPPFLDFTSLQVFLFFVFTAALTSTVVLFCSHLFFQPKFVISSSLLSFLRNIEPLAQTPLPWSYDTNSNPPVIELEHFSISFRF